MPDKEPLVECPGCGADCGFAFDLRGVPNALCEGTVEIIDYDATEDYLPVHRCAYHRRWEDDPSLPLFPRDDDDER